MIAWLEFQVQKLITMSENYHKQYELVIFIARTKKINFTEPGFASPVSSFACEFFVSLPYFPKALTSKYTLPSDATYACPRAIIPYGEEFITKKMPQRSKWKLIPQGKSRDQK